MDEENEALKKLPKTYAFVDQSVWSDFVSSRVFEGFQTIREAQVERKPKNKYNNRISREGHVSLEEELVLILIVTNT